MSLAEHVRHSEVGHRPLHEAVRQTDLSLPRGFEPIELAGIGAFAEVWKAMELATGRMCALKRLRPERCDEPIARQLVHNEAQACQAVTSRHLLKMLRSELHADVPFLVFEWLDGRTLEDELRIEERLSLRRAVWIARQTADGMRDLECAGLAHGDIKPQNIFITHHGEVKLLDLGFVRPITPSAGRPVADEFVGTPDYLAPESLTPGVKQPVIKDMYSLGITLYRMLTGRLPFVGSGATAVLVQHRQSKPTLLRRFRPDAPRELSDLLGRLLAKQPFRRPQDLRTLIRELVELELILLSSEINEDN
jgi:eukaryotic-like serine/threonine-protein kinase